MRARGVRPEVKVGCARQSMICERRWRRCRVHENAATLCVRDCALRRSKAQCLWCFRIEAQACVRHGLGAFRSARGALEHRFCVRIDLNGKRSRPPRDGGGKRLRRPSAHEWEAFRQYNRQDRNIYRLFIHTRFSYDHRILGIVETAL